MTVDYLRRELSSLLGHLKACDLLSSDFKVITAGPSATTLLVRATAMAVLVEQGRA